MSLCHHCIFAPISFADYSVELETFSHAKLRPDPLPMAQTFPRLEKQNWSILYLYKHKNVALENVDNRLCVLTYAIDIIVCVQYESRLALYIYSTMYLPTHVIYFITFSKFSYVERFGYYVTVCSTIYPTSFNHTWPLYRLLLLFLHLTPPLGFE